jgi:hypothetical protein
MNALRYPVSFRALLTLLGILVGAGGLACDAPPSADAPTLVRAEDGRFIRWVEHRIDDSELSGGVRLRGADGLEVADFDGDGREDLVAAHEDSNHLRLSFASEDPDVWETVTLAEGGAVGGVEDSAVGDLDADGDLHLVVACEEGLLVYFENPGGDDARLPERWQRVVPAGVRGRGSWIRVYLIDWFGDPTPEIVATNKSIPMPSGRGSMDVAKTPVSIFRLTGDPIDPSAWVEIPLGYYRVPVNARPIDLDADGVDEIVIGSRGEARMEIARRTGAAGGSQEASFSLERLETAGHLAFPLPAIPKRFSGFEIVPADLDGDGRVDLVTFETPWSIVWLEQPEALGDAWEVHPISAVFPDSPTALTLVDIDGDGRLDLFSGGYSDDPREADARDPGLFHRAGGLFWFEQPEDPRTPWIRHDISRRTRGMYDVFVARDMNGDGLVDFVGTRGNSGALDGVIWLEQRRSTEPARAFESAHPDDSRQLPPTPEWLRALVRWILL